MREGEKLSFKMGLSRARGTSGRLGGHISRWLELWDGGLEEMWEGADELGAVSTQMKSQA